MLIDLLWRLLQCILCCRGHKRVGLTAVQARDQSYVLYCVLGVESAFILQVLGSFLPLPKIIRLFELAT